MHEERSDDPCCWAIHHGGSAEPGPKGGFRLGVGVEYPMTGAIGVQADYRYLFLGSVFDGNAAADYSVKKYGGSQVTAG